VPSGSEIIRNPHEAKQTAHAHADHPRSAPRAGRRRRESTAHTRRPEGRFDETAIVRTISARLSYYYDEIAGLSLPRF
jgi:hypothetical protein